MNDEDAPIPPPELVPPPEPAGNSPGDELAEAPRAIEDARRDAESGPAESGPEEEPASPPSEAEGDTVPAPPPAFDAGQTVNAPEEAAATESAAAEQSGTYVYPDNGAAASQRLRLIPPDGKPLPWWVRHRRTLGLAELILTAFFLMLALYFIFLWLFGIDPAWEVAAEPGRWQQIVVHHTATGAGTPKSFDNYHRTVNKWENGLGYHFLIGNGVKDSSGASMRDGEVHVGRRWTRQLDGAHVKKQNAFSIGIALVGNFEEKPPTPNQLSSLKRLLGFLMQEYKVPREKVVGHSDVAVAHTKCPGKHMPLREIVDSL